MSDDLDEYGWDADLPDTGVPADVLTDQTADLLLARLARIEAHIAGKEAVARSAIAAETERVEAWLDRVTHRARDSARQIQAVLEEWGLDCRDTGRKSMTLPHGRVSTRENPGGWATVDEKALVGWARVHRPDLVEVRERFLTAEAKRASSGLGAAGDGTIVTGDGEVVPGLKANPPTVTVTVTTS